MIVEILITFNLILVVFGTAVDPNGPGHLAPILIGFAIAAAHMVAVPLTGASMNPARSFGPAVWSSYYHAHWIYWVGPFTGAVLAAMFYVHVLKRGYRSLGLAPAEEAKLNTEAREEEKIGENGQGPPEEPANEPRRRSLSMMENV